MNILIVEDDALIRSLLRAVLEVRGHAVKTASNVREAVTAWEKSPPDLVLQDLQVPGGGGEAVLRLVRNSDFAAVPVVAVTAQAMSGDRDRLLALGFDGYVSKPIDTETFGALVETFVKAPTRLSSPAIEDTGPKTVRHRVDMLHASFAKVLPTRMRDLVQAARACVADPTNLPLLRDAQLKAHTLRGTAGSFGFTKTADAVEKIELQLTALKRGLPVGKIQDGPPEEDSQEQRDFGGPSFTPVLRNRILVVDEDPMSLARLIELSSQSLVEVVPATTQDEALASASAIPIDAAIIDAHLSPGDGGYELARKLRALKAYPNLPLAFISSDRSLHNRIEAAHAGASLYLTKPVTSTALDETIRQLLALSRQEQSVVLVLDDDPLFAAAMVAMLAEAEIHGVALHDPQRILAALDDHKPDLVLLDANMPGVSGYDVCRMLRVSPRWQHVPVIFVTASADPKARAISFQAGADDFVQKPIVREELLARVSVRLERSRLLKERSTVDALTGLLRRSPFIERLGDRIADMRRNDKPLSVCLIDLDHFKRVNDTHGHIAGDNVLARFGGLALRRLRAQDLRCRWGGEEFVLVLPDSAGHTTRGVLLRILEDFAAMVFRGKLGEEFRCSFSAGVSCYPNDGTTTDELIAVADRRLYHAKVAGRRCVVIEG